MKVYDFIKEVNSDFFVGVPDSQLRPLCDYLFECYGTDPEHHIIAANEGNAVGLAAGYYLATGKVPVVYLQNSGIGNIINPVASLMNDKVYGIPCVFVVGWRGEPNVHDEPQHVFQGEVTLKLLKDMGINTCVIGKDTSEIDVQQAMGRFRAQLVAGKQVAFVIRKGALSNEGKVQYRNDYTLLREEAIRHIATSAGGDPVVSTTGKASRELFEIREAYGQTHERDFLTVGSMGHASSIALGIALQKTEKRVWVIDGDGAVLMHMGAMAVLGAYAPKNVIHIVLNNEAHETVGGMPTVANATNLVDVARACGYPVACCVTNAFELDTALQKACSGNSLTFIEVKCALGARPDLGRPTLTTEQNKNNFMQYLALGKSLTKSKS